MRTSRMSGEIRHVKRLAEGLVGEVGVPAVVCVFDGVHASAPVPPVVRGLGIRRRQAVRTSHVVKSSVGSITLQSRMASIFQGRA